MKGGDPEMTSSESMLRGRRKRAALVLLSSRGNQGLVGEVLREMGFAATIVNDPRDAMARLIAERFHLLIIEDPMLDGRAAKEFVLQLRHAAAAGSQRAWVLTLMRTASTDEVVAMRNAGVSGLLVGQLNLRGLIERLELMNNDRRTYIDCAPYKGPDRRTRLAFVPADRDRRRLGEDETDARAEALAAMAATPVG